MTWKLQHWLQAAVITTALVSSGGTPVGGFAQDIPAPPTAVGAKAAVKAAANVEVLTRGPIHEAFAEKVTLNATLPALVKTAPPQPLQEIPPASKPVDPSVTWIPGYWGWSNAENEYLWVSGTWRATPPGMRWIPGVWQNTNAGYRWNSGLWVRADAKQLSFNPAPPKSQEQGPNSVGDTKTQFWVPGSWEMAQGKYQWRAGFWSNHLANWVWVPAQNVVTGAGYVSVPGYWDHKLSARGQVFAPVRLTGAANATVGGSFTPSAALNLNVLPLHLFVQENSHAYYFGDYYDPQYYKAGMRPWYADQSATVGVDPLLGYYTRESAHQGVNYVERLTAWNAHFVQNEALRPATTLVNQLKLAEAEKGVAAATQTALAVPLTTLVAASPTKYVTLSVAQQTALGASVNQFQLLSTQRLNLENSVAKLSADAAVGQAINLPVQTLALPQLVAPVGATVGTSVAGSVGASVGGVVPNVVPGVVPSLPGVDGVGLPPVGDALQPAESILPDVGGGLGGFLK